VENVEKIVKIPLRKSLYGPTIHGQDIALEKDMGAEREKCVGKHAIWAGAAPRVGLP
jgi:hypothetical protein